MRSEAISMRTDSSCRGCQLPQYAIVKFGVHAYNLENEVPELMPDSVLKVDRGHKYFNVEAQ